MAKPLFSILHTSARPDKWRAVYDDWMSKAVHPERVEYVLCVDDRWGFKLKTEEDMEAFPAHITLVENVMRRCYVDGVNIAARASSGSILIVNADDQFACDGWDEQLKLAALGDVPDEHQFVIEVSTGTPNEHDRGILVMPILSRARYEKQGGFVFYPEYESMFADNDFCEWARRDGIVIDARHLMFPHRHPMADAIAGADGWSVPVMDEAYKAQMRPEAWKLGETLFAWRKRIQFGKAIEHAATIEGWMFPNELACLSLWASQFESVVEIGSWKGRSTYALCKGTAGKVYAVDTFAGSPDEPEHVEKVQAAGGSTYLEFEHNTIALDNLRVWQADSVAIAPKVPDVDMVFIDGGHSYEQVLADLKAWAPKTKKFICGHDFDHPPVARAVREVLGNVERGQGSLWFKAVAAPAKRSIALCLSGERFEGPWVDALLTLYGHLIDLDFSILKLRAFTYTSNVYVTRQEIQRAVVNYSPKPDLLLWLDDDNLLSPKHFNQLLAGLDGHPEVDGISGWCWIHNEHKQGFHISCGLWSPDHLHWDPFPPSFANESELKPFEVGGFPCFLMRMSALEKAGDGAFLPVLDNRLEHGLTGEDISYFLDAEKGGAKFLVDPRVKVPHLKYVSVEPTLPEEGKVPVKVACMVRAKNEGRWIARVIEAVKPLCWPNIYVMEDGSTDGTADIATMAGATVWQSPFVGLGLDERRDKNWFLEAVKARCSPDWVLMPDGDEELQPGGCEAIRRVLESNPPVDCFALRILNLWNELDTIRLDGVYGPMHRQSLFRASLEAPFQSFYEGTGKNHVGLHTSNAPGLGGLRISPLNVSLLHYGNMLKEDRIRKWRWIRSLDPGNEAEGLYLHMVQGDERDYSPDDVCPNVPADAKLKHAGPLKLGTLPARLVPKFEVMPIPLVEQQAVGSSATV